MATADLETAIGLRTLAQQVARGCFADLSEAVKKADGQDVEPGRELLRLTMRKARERLMRLSILIHGAEHGALDAGLVEAQRCRRLERHVTSVLQCGESMARFREQLPRVLATRQHDIRTASSITDPQMCAGWPAMTQSLVASLGKPAVAWHLPAEGRLAARRHLVHEMLWRFAESTCPKGAGGVLVQLLEHGAKLEVPDTFSIELAYNLHRWSIIKSHWQLTAGALRTDDELMLRQHLQALTDQPNVLSVLHTVPLDICSRLWLRAMHSKALTRLSDKSSVWWDRRGSLIFRLPEADAIAQGQKTAKVTVADTESCSGLTLGAEQLRRRACVVRLTADGGNIRVDSPQLSWPLITARELAEGGPALFDDLFSRIRCALATRVLEDTRTSLVDGGHVSPQDAQLLQGPALLLDWRACSVYISVDTEGQLLLSSETSPPLVCTGNLVVRLETARRSALLQLIDDERRVAGWICRDRATDASSAVPYVYTLRDHALALSLGLGDTEMASPSLCLAKQGVPEAVKLSVNVLAPGLEPISARSNASSFRSRVGHMFIVAKVLIEAAPFCAEVLEAVSEGVTTQSSLTCKLFVGTQGTKLEGVLSWREATRTPFTPPVRLQIDEQRREWSFHGTLRRSVLLTCPYDESERCTQVVGPALSDTASLRTGCALSGERILLPRGDGFGVVKVVAINYTSELPWKLWPADWAALECLAEMASQAGGEEATDLPIRLEICQLGRLQWFVPGLSVDGERFELVARPLGDSTEIPADDVDADKGGVADCPCYFRWNSPNHFIFAENLSWQLCRSRDLAKTLHRLPAMLEFGRLCEQLSAESWKIHTIGTTTFGVELQGMGIEFRVADEGLVCRCLSRRNNRLAPVPNVKGFVCMLSSYAGSAAKGNVFEYTPGKLASQSSSLWAYLRSVRVLYQVFASLRKGLARWSLAGEDVHESMCREEHRIQWGLLEREVPALGATCGLEVSSGTFVSGRPEQMLKRRRMTMEVSAAPAAPPKLLLVTRFFRRGIESAVDPGDKFLCDHVCRSFETFFAAAFQRGGVHDSTGEVIRNEAPIQFVAQICGILGLLSAPKLWILEDAVSLFSPMPVDGTVWTAPPDKVTFFHVPDPGVDIKSEADVTTWVLQFTVQSCQGAHTLRCLAQEGEPPCNYPGARPDRWQDASPKAGWCEISFDGKALIEVGRLFKAQLEKPYRLAEVLPRILKRSDE